MRRRLGESDTGIDEQRAGVDTRFECVRDPQPQLVDHLTDDIVVVRRVLHRARGSAHVHRDVRGPGRGRDPHELGLRSAARHVVHHPRTRVERGPGDRGFRRVDAHGDAGPVGERAHHRKHPAQLFVGVDGRGTRAGRLAPDVDHGRARRGQLEPVGDRCPRSR